MSFCYKLVVMFPYESDIAVQAAVMSARRDGIFETDDDGGLDVAAEIFLRDLRHRRCMFGGPKGDMVTWGVESNYYSAKRMSTDLRPLWDRLLRRPAMFTWEKIVIVSQAEQTDCAQAVSIWRDGGESSDPLVIGEPRDCPFSFLREER